MARRWLLEVDLGGRIRRWCSGSSDVTTGGFVWRAAIADLSLSRPSEEAFSVSFDLPDDTDWGGLLAVGVVLEERLGTLYRWTEGQAFATADVWATGRARNVQAGEASDGLAFVLAMDAAADSDTLLIPQSRIDLTTMAPDPVNHVRADSDGIVYPVVIGYPGHHPDVGTPWNVVPVVIRNQQYAPTTGDTEILFSEGECDAASILVSNAEAGHDTMTFAPTTKTDDLGALITVGTFTGAGETAPGDTTTVSYWAGYQEDTTYGGGILDPYGPGVLKGAGQAIRWAMRRSAGRLRFDHGDFDRFVGWFDAYRIDTYCNDQDLKGWAWVRDVVLPMLPHRLVQTGRGLSVRPLVWACSTTHSVMVLEQGRNVDRDGRSRRWDPGAPPANEVTVEYRQNRGGGRFLSRRTLTAQYERPSRLLFAAGVDSRVYPHPLAVASQRAYSAAGTDGIYPVTLQLPHVWHDETAELVAATILQARALPHQRLTYTGQDAAIETLYRGDVVTLIDAEMSYTAGVAAIVDDVRVGGAAPEADLIVPHPLVRGA